MLRDQKDSKMYSIYDEQDDIDKKVGDLIFLTSHAGNKLGIQKNAVKNEMDKK